MNYLSGICISLIMSGSLSSTLQAQEISESNVRSTPQAVLNAFEVARKTPSSLRQFLTALPKGGDLHNHLVGAIYAESYIKWAAEDGLCIDTGINAIVPAESGKACDVDASQAMQSGPVRDNLINGLSMRSFVPTSGWAGHDHFFSTFNKMFYANTYQYGNGPLRSGDMLAEVASRAASQNLGYLELLHTMELGTILSVVPADFGNKELTIEGLYAALMRGPFGKELPKMISTARAHLDLATNRKNQLLDCETNNKACGVEMLFLHQVIREFSLPQVFAQLILGAELSRLDSRMVGLNMVAPEHGAVAMRDYDKHMQMIDFLWKRENEAHNELNVTLHAGELTLGLVPPHGLKNHIRSAIELGHAKRIGHGVDIIYEDDSAQLLEKMATEKIMVEINLSSNESILGVKGDDHPYALYRQSGVPLALSTDDEGVSRIDITNEYMRAVLEQGADYDELLSLSRNSLIYSFLPGESLWNDGAIINAACAKDLEERNSEPSEGCQTYLNTSPKATLQWNLENYINHFEGFVVSTN